MRILGVLKMTIFQLALFVCTTIQPSLTHELYSKECNWEVLGLYIQESKCEVEGSQQHGKPFHRFSHIIGSIVTTENHRCSSISVSN